ncbi:vanadium-dependent haloperoxidase [Actinoplanes auranticolor]|uniref:vanadium-dependent haloperoxidase n=1 Tax=Actinoplanes auranticolor TaxID=47988 RepID=UPI001BB3314C|nr:vanadium-dependent haloperoxidase [Actinoplanes auranticolor]
MSLSGIQARPSRRISALAIAILLFAALFQVVLPVRPARAVISTDHVTFWNTVLINTYRQLTGDAAAPTRISRAGAIMHVAVYDAANSVLCARRAADCLGQPYAIKVAGGGDFNTAVDYAAYTTLTSLYPSLAGVYQARLAEAQDGVVASPQQAAGRSIGEQAAQAILQRRAGDGSDAPMSYTYDGVPGAFQQIGTGAPVTPQWGAVRPFVMTSGSQFRPPMPGEGSTYDEVVTGAEYTAQFDEARRLGSRDSTERTADQTRAAFFWANDADGTYKPPGQLFSHTQTVANGQNVSAESRAKLFAQVAIAMADAAILAWDAKYNTPVDLWRPVTGINQADTDNNPDTPKVAWQPLAEATPNFPAYVSGHATFAYTWATVMQHWFGRDNIRFTGDTDDPDATVRTRTLASFSAAADENAHSRLWLGVHWHFDADAVLNPGTELGEYSVDNSLYYNSSPTELLYQHRDGVTNARTVCNNTGRQLSNEHRWEFWRCAVSGSSFDLFVR